MSENFIKTYKIIDKIKYTGMIIGGLTVLMMIFLGTVDVLLRNFLGQTFVHSYEFIQYWLMPVAVFSALPYTYGAGIMPRLEFIIVKMRDKYQFIGAYFVLSVEILLFSLLAFYGWTYAIDVVTTGKAFSVAGNDIPLAPVIFLVPLSFSLIVVEIIFTLIKNIKEQKISFKVYED